MQLDANAWVMAVRDLLVSGFAQEDAFTRYVAVQALAQLVAVVERSVKVSTMMMLEVSVKDMSET